MKLKTQFGVGVGAITAGVLCWSDFFSAQNIIIAGVVVCILTVLEAKYR